MIQSMISEIILTAMYVSVCLSMTYYRGTDKLVCALVIVFTLFAALTMGASISGGCINPAVGIAQ